MMRPYRLDALIKYPRVRTPDLSLPPPPPFFLSPPRTARPRRLPPPPGDISRPPSRSSRLLTFSSLRPTTSSLGAPEPFFFRLSRASLTNHFVLLTISPGRSIFLTNSNQLLYTHYNALYHHHRCFRPRGLCVLCPCPCRNGRS